MKQLIIMIPETEEEKRNHSITHNFVTVDGRYTAAGEAAVKALVEILCKASFVNADRHGWYDELWLGTSENEKAELGERNFGEVIALITSELSEALESYRDGEKPLWYRDSEGQPDDNPYGADEQINKAEGLIAEFADAIIRITDYVGAYKFSKLLGEALVDKHAYNVTRPFKHGGKAL